MKDSITFETITQAAIFEHELKGQISDGHWENDASSNYETWCDAEVKVSDDEDDLGRTFWVSKNLGFGSKTLFNWVGDRMQHYGRMALIADRLFPNKTLKEKLNIASVLSDCVWPVDGSDGDDKPSWKGLPKYIRERIATGNYWAMDEWNAICDAGPVNVLAEAVDAFVDFTEDDARKDTLRISKIAKIEH